MARLFNTSNIQTQPVARGGRLFGGTTAKAGDLKSVEGLRRTAEQAGLGGGAESILKTKGEKPKEIFSGGVVSDTFDVLNALQYGVTGLIKGKSFSEGVKTRQSFSDKDALGDFGLPGTIAGIAMDIAVDPLTYLGGFGILKKGVQLGVKAVTPTASKLASTKLGESLASRMVYRFGQDPVYKAMDERRIKTVGAGVSNLMDIVKPITKLDSKAQTAIATARKAGKLDDLPKELLDTAKPAFDEVDKLGKEAVDVGLLSAETYAENVGKYIARLYRKHEVPKGLAEKIKTPFLQAKPLRIDLSRFKKRTDIPEDVREAMGEILEAGYPTAKGLVQLKTAVENAKFFKQVNKSFGKDVIEEGFEKLPDTKRLGELAGRAVPKPIADSINEIVRPSAEGFEKALGNTVRTFKFSKVILNPATHARNVMSNFILNNFEGLSPARLDIYASAAKQIATKGDLYKEAKATGLGIDTFAAQELKTMLVGPEMGTMSSKLKNAANKIADIYQKEEEWAKMSMYIFQKSKGLSPDEALKVAERATFNYAQVTPFIRKLRESIFGYPFITFTYKVTPQVVKTLATKPTKISNIGKIKQGIEGMSDIRELERERASEAPWVRDGFYIKLPVKDKHGRSMYFDMTYILPFGDLVSGELVERRVERETGLRETLPESLIGKLPFLNIIKEVGKNQDFRGDKIVRESDEPAKQGADLFRYLLKFMAPPLVGEQLPGGITPRGERRPGRIAGIAEQQKRAKEGKEVFGRTPIFELLRNVGLKIDPVDAELQESFMDSEKRKALQTLLKESGVISDFAIPFIPKEKTPQRGRLFK